MLQRHRPGTDTELARAYEVDISEWYVPMNIVTRELDYPDVAVQVGGRRGTWESEGKNRDRRAESEEKHREIQRKPKRAATSMTTISPRFLLAVGVILGGFGINTSPLMADPTATVGGFLPWFCSQAEIQATDERMLEEEYVVGPVDSWLNSFVEWAGASTEYR